VQLGGSSLQGQLLTPGSSLTLNLATQGSGVLNAWIDWNRNGSFENAGEKIAANVSPTANAIALNVTVPSGARVGITYARFRFSSDANLLSTGYASDGEVEDGEVEDYQVAIAQPKLLLVKRITAINPDQPDAIQFNNFVNDGSTTDDEAPNWPDSDSNPSINTHLRGAIMSLLSNQEMKWNTRFIFFLLVI
jgi:hypothetical protein